jgi:transcriptional regulator with XRE-family HTH domain
MTGDEFQQKLEEAGYSQRQLAERWGVSHTTIQRVRQAQEVRGLYADAIRHVLKRKS